MKDNVLLNKVVTHAVERIVSFNPIVTATAILGVGERDNTPRHFARIEIYNYESGERLVYGGSPTNPYLEGLHRSLVTVKKKDSERSTEAMAVSSKYSFDIVRKNRPPLRVFTFSKEQEAGIAYSNMEEAIDFFSGVMLDLGKITAEWLKKKTISITKLNADIETPHYTARFINPTSAGNAPVALIFQKPSPDALHIETRFLRIVTKGSCLVIRDFDANPDVHAPDFQPSQIFLLIKRINEILLHILNYDNKSHLFPISIAENQQRVDNNLMGYGSLVQTSNSRRVVINFDQNITCSKVHWIYEREFTQAIQQALQTVVDNYYN